MIVECRTADQFITELRRTNDRILEKLVRVRIDKVPEQAEELSHVVAIWGTAIVCNPDGLRGYQIEYGEICGADEGDNYEASERADQLRIKLADAALLLGLSIGVGKWHT